MCQARATLGDHLTDNPDHGRRTPPIELTGPPALRPARRSTASRWLAREEIGFDYER